MNDLENKLSTREINALSYLGIELSQNSIILSKQVKTGHELIKLSELLEIELLKTSERDVIKSGSILSKLKLFRNNFFRNSSTLDGTPNLPRRYWIVFKKSDGSDLQILIENFDYLSVHSAIKKINASLQGTS